MLLSPSRNLLVPKIRIFIRVYYSKYQESLFLFQLFTKYFSRPIKSVLYGSVDFNLTMRALGQRFFLTFHVSSVTGKTILGGKKRSFINLLI